MNHAERNVFAEVSAFRTPPMSRFLGRPLPAIIGRAPNLVKRARGVYIVLSSYNKLYHNNLINNTQQVFSWDQGLPYQSVNTWDDGYPSGGNYWSDYTDVDEKSGPYQDQPGSDGIWDHPYVIDVDNTDNYPLVEPWSPKPTDARAH